MIGADLESAAQAVNTAMLVMCAALRHYVWLGPIGDGPGGSSLW